MLKDNKIWINGGYLLAGVAVVSIVAPSEEVMFLDKRLMCGPPPFHMSDLHEDGPQPLETINTWATITFTGSTTAVLGGLPMTYSRRFR